jgi:hypothetical protein
MLLPDFFRKIYAESAQTEDWFSQQWRHLRRDWITLRKRACFYIKNPHVCSLLLDTSGAQKSPPEPEKLPPEEAIWYASHKPPKRFSTSGATRAARRVSTKCLSLFHYVISVMKSPRVIVIYTYVLSRCIPSWCPSSTCLQRFACPRTVFIPNSLYSEFVVNIIDHHVQPRWET